MKQLKFQLETSEFLNIFLLFRINLDHQEPLNARMLLETLSPKKFVEFYIKMILSHLMVRIKIFIWNKSYLVFILDTWDNVFIWLGNESSNSEQEAVQDLAKEYLASSPSKRKGIGLDCFKKWCVIK